MPNFLLAVQQSSIVQIQQTSGSAPIDAYPTGSGTPTPGLVANVFNLAALQALPMAGMPDGSLATVQTVGALWVYRTSQTQPVDGITVVAAAGGLGAQWWRAQTLIAVEALNQTAWVISPATGNDQNDGAIAPLQTFAEAFRRMGTTEPVYPEGVVPQFILLDPQALNVDPVFFSPQVSGGGIPSLIGTLAEKFAPFVGGAVTPKTVGAPGNLLQVAGFPALSAVGDYVLNVTKNSYATVKAVVGTTVTVSTPIPSASVSTVGSPVFAVDNTWATGDTFHVFTRPLCNLKRWRVTNGDAISAGLAAGAWVQWISVADASGTGQSFYAMIAETETVYSGCSFQGRTHTSALAGRGTSNVLLGCDCVGQLLNVGGLPAIFAGYCTAAISTTATAGGGGSIAGDAILAGGGSLGGTNTVLGSGALGGLYAGAAITLLPAAAVLSGVIGGIWGPGSLNARPAAAFEITANTAANVIQLAGTLTLPPGTATTGTSFTPGTGLWVSAIALTPANIDANHGLQDPITGARFCFQA